MYELKITAPEQDVETITQALEELDALSVSVEDANADTENEKAIFGEPNMPAPAQSWETSKILALYENEEKTNHAAQILLMQDFFARSQISSINKVEQQDWVRLTQSQFNPVEITEKFWIVPSWHQAPEGAEKIIKLDPGLAFGTGTHPTTSMCLKYIAQNPPLQKTVLDYGCGSGILAIGAALHGAAQIDAIDIDPAAVQSSIDNANTNQVKINAFLPDDKTANELKNKKYQLVIANILATPLKVLAPLLCNHIEKDGTIILAGILERQYEEMQAAYAPYIKLEKQDTKEGWILLIGKK